MQNYCFSVLINQNQYSEVVKLAEQYGHSYKHFYGDASKPSADFSKSREGRCYLEFDHASYNRKVPFDLLEGLLILLSLGIDRKLAFNTMGLDYV